MPPRASGHHCIRASSPRAFSRPVPSALAVAHTYRKICQVPCALPERPFRLVVSLSVVPAVLFDGFTLQFVPAGLNHCVQHNLPLWSEGDVMRLLRRHLEVMVDFQILLDIAWLLLMLVLVSPQISVPSLMSPLPSRS